MISHIQVRKIASDLLLPEETIEKDYFIELFLYYIFLNKNLRNLIFRGGTCLKKIYFPDYRFSEDLDFLIKGETKNILQELLKITEKINQDFPAEVGEVESKRILQNGRLQIFFSYNIVSGIFSANGKELKVDILEDSFLPPFRDRSIRFSYQDLKGFKAIFPSYDLESIAADKIGRLLDVVDEPRDIYDLWKLLVQDLEFNKVEKTFENKYGYHFSTDRLISEIQKQSYKINWENRLANQVSNLPDFGKVKSELEKLIQVRFKNSNI